MLFCRLLIFFKKKISKNSFRNTIRMSNSLDPDQAQWSVKPYLGPNCLQKLSVDDTQTVAGKQLSTNKQFTMFTLRTHFISVIDEFV